MRPRDKFVLAILLVLELAGSSLLNAANCDSSNPNLTCQVELIRGFPVTHYRVKGATSTSRAWTWLQTEFPSVFGKAPPFDKGIALLVGVADYEYLHPLPNVRNDLSRMRDYLLTEEKFDDVYILADDDVTARAVETLLLGYFRQADVVGDEDRFLFYYSGHGSNEIGVGQMQFSKANPAAYDANANLSVSQWRDWGRALHAKQALFLFDACALGNELVRKGSDEGDSDYLRDLSREKGRFAFAATRGGEATYGDEDSSYFTREFLRVVEEAKADVNGVGFMTIGDIGGAMQARLNQLARQYGYKWHFTSPTSLDPEQYPGTFVFLNPKVPNNPEARFAKLTGQSLGKGIESPPTSTPVVSPYIPPTPTPRPTYGTPVSTPTLNFPGSTKSSAGHVTIHPNKFCDLDAGREVQDNSRGEADFGWSYRQDLGRGFIIPMNISAFALMNSGNFGNVSRENIQALNLTVGSVKRNGASFSNSELTEGQIYGYVTRSHNIGKFLVLSNHPSLVISFVNF